MNRGEEWQAGWETLWGLQVKPLLRFAVSLKAV